MEEAHGVGEGILDEHAPGIAGDELLGGGGGVIGEQDGRLVMAEILDEELAVGPLEKSYLLLEDAWCAEFTAGEIEVDGAPCRRWQLLDLGKELW